MAVPLSSSALHTLLVSLVERRHKQIAYLKQVYSGQSLYMNTVRLSIHQFDISNPQCVLDASTYAARCHIYTILGLSLARLIELKDQLAYIDGLSMLSNELIDYQRYFMHETVNHNADNENNQSNFLSNKPRIAVHIARKAPPTNQSIDQALDQSNQSNNQSIYPKNLHLFTQLYMPASLTLESSKNQSLPIIFNTLMDLLPQVYSKLINNQPANGWTVELTQRILSIDRKLRDELITAMMNDAQLAAQRIEKEEFQKFHNVTSQRSNNQTVESGG